MKKVFALLMFALTACAGHTSVYDEIPLAVPEKLELAVHNNSSMTLDVYSSRFGTDKQRLRNVPLQDVTIPLRSYNVDDAQCLRVLVHYVGDAQNYLDWVSPLVCLTRGGIFDLTVSEQPQFNVLIVTPRKTG